MIAQLDLPVVAAMKMQQIKKALSWNQLLLNVAHLKQSELAKNYFSVFQLNFHVATQIHCTYHINMHDLNQYPQNFFQKGPDKQKINGWGLYANKLLKILST